MLLQMTNYDYAVGCHSAPCMHRTMPSQSSLAIRSTDSASEIRKSQTTFVGCIKQMGIHLCLHGQAKIILKFSNLCFLDSDHFARKGA